MRKQISILLLVMLTTALLGCNHRIEEKTYLDFVAKLKELHFKVEAEDAEDDILQGKRKWLTVNEDEHLAVYLYESSEKMEEDASYLDGGGASYSNGNNSVKISWASLPHFYKKDNMIVLYVGENTDLTSALEQILGIQFSGYRK